MSLALSINMVLLWVLLIFNLLLSLSIVKKLNEAGLGEPRFSTLKKGAEAPDFEVEDIRGRKRSLADFGADKVALVFSSSSCSPCREKIPELAKMADKAQRAGYDLVIVSMDEASEARAFAEEHGITVPVLAAPLESSSIKEDYKVAGTPFFCVLDSERRVVASDFLNEEWEQIVASWA